jgi:hypothetical protein
MVIYPHLKRIKDETMKNNRQGTWECCKIDSKKKEGNIRVNFKH